MFESISSKVFFFLPSIFILFFFFLSKNPETIPLDILNQFITCISHLRCHDLVPIQLVLCSMAYDPSRWHSLECFTGNVVVKDIHVPSSTEVLNHFLDCLSSIPNEANDDDVIFPIILSKEVLLNLRGQFNDFHGSIVSFLYQMKSALAHHFARKGKDPFSFQSVSLAMVSSLLGFRCSPLYIK